MSYGTVAEIFSQISGVYDRFLGLISGGRIHSWQRELLSMMSCTGNWLDVGTGTGEVLGKLGDRQRSVRVGIDPSSGMLCVARKKYPNIHFAQAVGESLPFKGESFGCVSLSLVFRHLQDKGAFLKEARRVLVEGGRLGLIDVGRFRGTGAVVLLMKTVLRVPGVLIFGRHKWDFFIHSVEESYTVEEVKDMLEREGFKVYEVRKKLMGMVFLLVATKSA